VVSNDSYGNWLSFDTSSASIITEQSLFELKEIKVHSLQTHRPNLSVFVMSLLIYQ
jgi:hypothetical protein